MHVIGGARRRKLLACLTGFEELVPVGSVRDQVSHALNDVSLASNQQQNCAVGDGGSPDGFTREKQATWLKRNRWSAKQVVMIGHECLYANVVTSASLHKLVRLMLQQRLDGSIEWRLMSRCLRLANKRGLRGPKVRGKAAGRKTDQEYKQCLELLVNAHACEVRCCRLRSVSGFRKKDRAAQFQPLFYLVGLQVDRYQLWDLHI